ncbi:general stress protein [Nostoc sp. MG11]|uniref:general stress protein n=1 Tax=Nostoc sp. MG11 TaxID=2721166 RepID=UPI0018694254|nr:general stress protein [Nostoc sp. MG11]
MTLTGLKHAIGVFPNHQEAEQALRELIDAGFSFDQVSVIAKDADGKLRGADMTNPDGNLASEGAKTGAIAGGAAGGLVGLFEGLAVLAIPGVGPGLALGTVLANTLLGGGIGAATGGLFGGLIGWGIPEDEARFYNDRVSQGDYLVIVEATESEIRRAEAILNNRGIRQWRVYDAPRNVGHSQMNVISRQPGID